MALFGERNHMIGPDLEDPLRPARPNARSGHNWSKPSVKTRLEAAVRLRQVEGELERDMPPEARAAFNRVKRKERARAFGAIFDWKIDVAGFHIDALSPRGAAARGLSCGGQAIRDRDAGLDHLEYYREGRRPVAIVGQPYAPAFECGKREGAVAEVERQRGIRIVELNPVLGWHSNDPADRCLDATLDEWRRRGVSLAAPSARELPRDVRPSVRSREP
jgi:hypothetical protein